MELNKIQSILSARAEGDHWRLARISHFMGLLKTGVDGMASLGVVLRVEAEGMSGDESGVPPPPDTLGSLDRAIAFMQGVSGNASHEERQEDQIRNG